MILDSSIRIEQFLPLTILSAILLVYYSRQGEQKNAIAYNIPDPGNIFRFIVISKLFFSLECTGIFNLCTDADKDRLGRQAIKTLHEQMDDDKDGMIEASESSDVSF